MKNATPLLPILASCAKSISQRLTPSILCCGGWRHLLCYENSVRRCVGYVVSEGTNRKLGATGGNKVPGTGKRLTLRKNTTREEKLRDIPSQTDAKPSVPLRELFKEFLSIKQQDNERRCSRDPAQPVAFSLESASRPPADVRCDSVRHGPRGTRWRIARAGRQASKPCQRQCLRSAHKPWIPRTLNA
jgi:hypothetical protein